MPGEGCDEDFRVFAYNELKAASQSFHPSNKIGEGGFGSVYKVVFDYLLSRTNCIF